MIAIVAKYSILVHGRVLNASLISKASSDDYYYIFEKLNWRDIKVKKINLELHER